MPPDFGVISESCYSFIVYLIGTEVASMSALILSSLSKLFWVFDPLMSVF